MNHIHTTSIESLSHLLFDMSAYFIFSLAKNSSHVFKLAKQKQLIVAKTAWFMSLQWGYLYEPKDSQRSLYAAVSCCSLPLFFTLVLYLLMNFAINSVKERNFYVKKLQWHTPCTLRFYNIIIVFKIMKWWYMETMVIQTWATGGKNKAPSFNKIGFEVWILQFRLKLLKVVVYFGWKGG